MLDQVVGGDFIREPRQSGKPGVHVECPFEAEHSSFGGGGTFVVNAGDNFAEGYEGGFTFNCQHNACFGRDRLDFLKELLDQGVIDGRDLINKDFLLELEDDDVSSTLLTERSLAKIGGLALSEEDRARQRLNDTYSFIHFKGKVMVAYDTDALGAAYDVMTVNEFQLWERDNVVMRQDVTTGKMTRIKMADDWLDDNTRHKYTSMGFYPEEHSDPNVYNTFRGWKFYAKEGDSSKLRYHLLHNVCECHQDRFEYLMI